MASPFDGLLDSTASSKFGQSRQRYLDLLTDISLLRQERQLYQQQDSLPTRDKESTEAVGNYRQLSERLLVVVEKCIQDQREERTQFSKFIKSQKQTMEHLKETDQKDLQDLLYQNESLKEKVVALQKEAEALAGKAKTAEARQKVLLEEAENAIEEKENVQFSLLNQVNTNQSLMESLSLLQKQVADQGQMQDKLRKYSQDKTSLQSRLQTVINLSKSLEMEKDLEKQATVEAQQSAEVLRKKVVKLSTEIKVLKSSNTSLQTKLVDQQQKQEAKERQEKQETKEKVDRASNTKKPRISLSASSRKPLDKVRHSRDLKKSSNSNKLTQTQDGAIIALSHLSWDLESIFFQEFPSKNYSSIMSHLRAEVQKLQGFQTIVEAGRKKKEEEPPKPTLKRTSHSVDHLKSSTFSDRSEVKKKVRLTFLKEREPRIKLIDKPPRAKESTKPRQKSPKKTIRIVKIKKSNESPRQQSIKSYLK